MIAGAEEETTAALELVDGTAGVASAKLVPPTTELSTGVDAPGTTAVFVEGRAPRTDDDVVEGTKAPVTTGEETPCNGGDSGRCSRWSR